MQRNHATDFVIEYSLAPVVIVFGFRIPQTFTHLYSLVGPQVSLDSRFRPLNPFCSGSPMAAVFNDVYNDVIRSLRGSRKLMNIDKESTCRTFCPH